MIKNPAEAPYFLSGGGNMGTLIREKDWHKNVLGNPEGWPQSLRTTLSILLNSKFPMFLWWGPELICFYNDAYRPSLGENGKHPSILGMRAKDAWPEIWEMIKPLIDQVLSGGDAIWFEDQLVPIYRNGGIEDVYWTFSYSPVYDDGGKISGVIVICTETTDKRALLQKLELVNQHRAEELEKKVRQRTEQLTHANEMLKKSEERYHMMVEEVQDYAILYISPEGTIENWNIGAEKIKGYKADEIIGRNFSVFYTENDRENDLPRTLLNRAAKYGKAQQEGWRVRKDGTWFWANVTITAVHNEKKKVIGYSKVTHDLTEKKNADDTLKKNAAELQEKNEELKRINKELEAFAYVSSHDLQEPLRKIQTFASRILQKEYENLTASGKDHFKRMQLAAARMQTLIDDLLTYSRTNTAISKFEKTKLNELIEEVKEDMKEDLNEKKAVVESSGKCNISVIPFQFRQLMTNLIGNALKFSLPGRQPEIKIKSEIIKGISLSDERLSPNKKYCHITVSDNGIGFEQQYSEKIFEVFQRLHNRDTYKGTGIGLSIVKKIVENHQGVIKATGLPDQGATFDIYIPAN